MPLYFFDTSDGDTSVRDDTGLDYEDADAAREAALDALPDMAREKLPDGDARRFSVAVRDEAGSNIYTATMRLRGRWANQGSPLVDVADVLIEAMEVAERESDDKAVEAIRNVLLYLGETFADEVGHKAAGVKLN